MNVIYWSINYLKYKPPASSTFSKRSDENQGIYNTTYPFPFNWKKSSVEMIMPPSVALNCLIREDYIDYWMVEGGEDTHIQ
jgi:hypothetical protein